MIPLSAKEVHVWQCFLDELEDVGAAERLLSREERDRSARFHFEIDRRRFIHRRAIVRILLGGYLPENPARVEIDIGAHGKPGLKNGAIEFNLSHSHGLALFAFARVAVGIDVECIRDDFEFASLLPLIATPREQNVFAGLSSEQAGCQFFRLWTQKEAILKATGLGLSRSPAGFDASEGLNGGEWRAEVMGTDRRYTAAIALRGGGGRRLRFNWPSDLNVFRR